MHYAVEIPKDKGGAEFLDWVGGYYETGYSTNPHWVADFKTLPEHPTTRGVKPFAINDEWYYNMRFRPEMKGITPLLVAKPDDLTREGKSSSPRGPYKHVVEAKGRGEIVAWAVERADGGRGFGFTGGTLPQELRQPRLPDLRPQRGGLDRRPGSPLGRDQVGRQRRGTGQAPRPEVKPPRPDDRGVVVPVPPGDGPRSGPPDRPG